MNTQWNFDNTYIKLPAIFFTKQLPTPVSNPKPVIFNERLASTLDIPFDLSVFAGNKIPSGANSISQSYAGHQFGYFTKLGDGRAVLLGEIITAQNKRLDIQLKGSGKTPYSRGGDGRAALGPMLREYLISEAMFSLGVPTTQSLAVVETGESVIRDRLLRGAVLTRVADSHIRVGTFEYAARFGQREDLKALADYSIKRHYGCIANHENRYFLFLKQVIKRQAELIAKWQLIGFIHGVMNTDNMAISGETIDYGPCAFMDEYDQNTVFSSIDRGARYSFKSQPKMAAWNLARFAESLLPLFDDGDMAIKLLEKEIDGFQPLFQRYLLDGMRKKLGLFDKEEGDELLVNELLELMQKHKADYTNTFKALTLGESDGLALFAAQEFSYWDIAYRARLNRQDKSKYEIQNLMKSSNPAIIPRNFIVEKVLEDAENGDISGFNEFMSALKSPYAYLADHKKYCDLKPSASCSYQTFCGT